jgi:tetratricopeptide (TPR) repeat protein
MGAAGAQVTPEELAPKVYLPQRRGSLQAEMLAAPRRHGLVSMRVAPSLNAVLEEVGAGNPVIVLQNLALDWHPMWHYAVVVGYDLEAGNVILRSGRERRQVLPLTTFERTWARSGHWAMLAMPPHRLPQTVAEDAYLQAVIALEKSGFAAQARSAYEGAVAAWPQNLGAWMGAGNSAYVLGDYPAAEQAFRRAAELHPGSDAAFNNLAQALAAQGRLSAAESAARRALELQGPHGMVAAQTLKDIQHRSQQDGKP